MRKNKEIEQLKEKVEKLEDYNKYLERKKSFIPLIFRICVIC